MNDNEEALGHLLQIESEAAALVNDAQAEADRRLAESEKQNRAAYEERYHAETERLDAALKTEKEKIQNQYERELAAWREKLSALAVDMGRFSACLDGLLAGEA